MWQNVHIQTHTSGAEEPSERVTTLKTTDLLSTCTNKCMHGTSFFNEKGMGQPFSVFSCLCLTDQQHEFTWTQTKEAERRKNKLLSNQIFTFHQKPKLPLWLQQDCGVWSQRYSNCNGIQECLNVFVCLGKLLSLYSWLYFPFWVTVKCLFFTVSYSSPNPNRKY